jgi:hypothetical protein
MTLRIFSIGLGIVLALVAYHEVAHRLGWTAVLW